MKKILKWVLYFLTASAVFIILVLSLAYIKRDKILIEITKGLNNEVTGEFKIRKLNFTFFHNFPNFSISLHDVSLKDSLVTPHHRDVFSAQRIYLDVALLPLLKNEITVKALALDDASFFVYKGRDGYTNINVLKKRSDTLNVASSDKSFVFSVEKILCTHVAIVYADSITDKIISLEFVKATETILQRQEVYDIDINGDIHFDQLMLNKQSGHYLTDKLSSVSLHLSVDLANKLLTIQSSQLHFDEMKLLVSGEFELKKSGHYHLNFQSDKLLLNEAKPLLNEKIRKALHAVSIDQPVQVNVMLDGISTIGYKPNVDVVFQANEVTMKYGKLNFDTFSFSGNFNNHLDSTHINDDSNAQIQIVYFNGNLDRLLVSGRIAIKALKDPVIDLSLTSTIKYSDLNKQLDTSRIVLKHGKFKTNIAYKGKLSEYMDRNRTHYDGKLKGTLMAIDASLFLKSKKVLFNNINAQCDFDEKVFTIRDLSLKLSNNPISIKGAMNNFIPFFINPKNKGLVQLAVSTPNLDITWLGDKPGVVKKTSDQKQLARKKMTDLFDRIYQKLEFTVSVNAGQLSFREFVANDFSGVVKLSNTTFSASPVKMKVANGTVDLNFIMRDVFQNQSPISFKADVKNAEIKNFFISFSNFNQRTVHSDNISGNISASVKFDADLDDQYRVIPSTMRGELDCKIKDGVLKEFQPLMSMSNFLFKERDFSDIAFAEINSKFSIRGSAIEIGRMEVQSTVLSLFLQGYYSFQDSTTLSVQIPLSNLRRRNKNYKPENVGTDARVGPSIFLHIYNNKDIKGKMVIDYDPFKKWVK